MTEHTPGPWTYEPDWSGYYIRCTKKTPRGVKGIAVARTLRSGFSLDETIANARLLAAAPETAAERDRLKAVLESIANNRLSKDMPTEEKPEHDYAQGWDALVTAARAVLAKPNS